jgi:hypothetical protein
MFFRVGNRYDATKWLETPLNKGLDKDGATITMTSEMF